MCTLKQRSCSTIVATLYLTLYVEISSKKTLKQKEYHLLVVDHQYMHINFLCTCKKCIIVFESYFNYHSPSLSIFIRHSVHLTGFA